MTTTITMDLAGSNVGQANTPMNVMLVAAVNPDGSLIGAGGGSGGALNLTQVSGTAITLGQKAAAASLPVVLASDQASVPVSGTVSLAAAQLAAMSAFAFTAGSTQAIAATTTSANMVLGAAATGVLQIANTGTVVAFIALGTSAQTATTASYPILPGATVVISGGSATNIAAMTATGTATLYVSRGTGL